MSLLAVGLEVPGATRAMDPDSMCEEIGAGARTPGSEQIEGQVTRVPE